MNKAHRIKYLSSVGLLTAAVFAFSTVAPNHIIPDILATDHAVAKNGNGNGGNGNGGNGNGNGNGGNGNGGNGNGGGNDNSSANGNNGKSASSRGNGGNRGGKKSGGNLFGKVFGWAKEKPNKYSVKAKNNAVAASPASAHNNKNGKTKPKDLGIHPSDLKGGWMGVLMANGNGNFNSNINSVHGRARDYMESSAVAGYLAEQAANAAAAGEQLAGILDAVQKYEDDIAGLDPTLDADAEAIAAAEEALENSLPEGVSADEAKATYGAEIEEHGTVDAAKAAADAETLEAEMAATEAANQAEDDFEAVTKGKTPYDDEVATTIEDVLLDKDPRWGELQETAVEEQMVMDQAALADTETTVQ